MNHYPPETTIITFDLHKVLVSHDYRRMIHAWWKSSQRLPLVLDLAHPKVLWRVFWLRRSGSVAEKVLMVLMAEFPHLQQYRQLAIEILNAQKLIPESLACLKELKKKHYTLHIFSNIGEQLYQHLYFQNPELFDLFDVIHTTKQYNNYLAKPQKQAFLDYLSQHNSTHKRVIFIDDKSKNIATAQQCGIIGIQFKNPTKMRYELSLSTSDQNHIITR